MVPLPAALAALAATGFVVIRFIRARGGLLSVQILDGVTTSAGAVLSSSSKSFLQRLRAKVPSSTPLHVTSGDRSVEAQVAAMMTKYSLGGWQNLYDTYKADSVIDELQKVAFTPAAWAEVIRANASKISKHLAGRAFDLRTSTLGDSEIATIETAVRELGGSSLLEHSPAHLHVQF